MDKEKVFIFDMDGVITDTKNGLYALYQEFIESFGKKIGPGECSRLDGPKIEEIITYAKKEHDLPGSHQELLEKYNQKIETIYQSVKLVANVRGVIETLHKNKFKIALASSSKRKNINVVLQKFKIGSYFDFIVSGDEVSAAKPSPEIYNRVRDHFGDKEYYVIEDSLHGVTSAINAGMNVIFFNPYRQTKPNGITYTISRMEEMKRIISEIKADCKIIALARDIKVNIKQPELSFSSNDLGIIDALWNQEKTKNSFLFNGKMVSYHSHYFESNQLIINCFITEYKYFVAKLKLPSLNIPICPLAVSGVIIDSEGKVLLGQRKKVTEYENFYEFVPSGGLNANNMVGDTISFEKQIKAEFREETGMGPDYIKEITPFCVILDKKHWVYDICSKIFLKTAFPALFETEEYNHLHPLRLQDILGFINNQNIVPTSSLLLGIMNEGE
ncbi:HAD-IA family hydrolase [Candidatus Woesearchaeota archaeon]|nr:HAD-IA family hydrolase [Candidatus Woesearchaeota archaeon]